eukprot:CAMPEP_0182432336 /NCGR_PEP_ID=MMETSP1167-20130531/55572_1 /TAXON_ID=2988 /ORGANISM="Mallomonas Sp, Strain CCMP3275" /LENGTH=114 /DNA_ID=CAMNT_0024619717 /DNA_START=346 /DNA_END=690 /DNA_ORIENTATION=+
MKGGKVGKFVLDGEEVPKKKQKPQGDYMDTYPWCKEMKSKYNVKPGQSFGDLPVRLHATYLNAKCYRYFCKPHPKAGKGVFPCEELDASHLDIGTLNYVTPEDMTPLTVDTAHP